MQIEGVILKSVKADLVQGRATLSLTIDLDRALAERELLEQWAENETGLIVTIRPAQPELPLFGGDELRVSLTRGIPRAHDVLDPEPTDVPERKDLA